MSIGSQFIPHDSVLDAMEELKMLPTMGMHATGAYVQFLVGPTRVGKTDLVKRCFSDPEYEHRQDEQGNDIRPVVIVEAPERGTGKAIAEVILEGLGDPFAKKGSVFDMTNRIIHLIREEKTQLLVIDEVNPSTSEARYGAANFYKSLSNRIGCPMLLIGLPDALELARSNPQLAGRGLAPIELQPFDWRDKEHQKQFRRILRSMEDSSGGRFEKNTISDYAMAAAIHIATGGLIGLVVQLLDAAVMVMERAKRKRIGMTLADTLAEAFAGVAKNHRVTPQLNPFTVALPATPWAPLPFSTGVNPQPRLTAKPSRSGKSDREATLAQGAGR
jgi:hypothetical protein